MSRVRKAGRYVCSPWCHCRCPSGKPVSCTTMLLTEEIRTLQLLRKGFLCIDGVCGFQILFLVILATIWILDFRFFGGSARNRYENGNTDAKAADVNHLGTLSFSSPDVNENYGIDEHVPTVALTAAHVQIGSEEGDGIRQTGMHLPTSHMKAYNEPCFDHNFIGQQSSPNLQQPPVSQTLQSAEPGGLFQCDKDHMEVNEPMSRQDGAFLSPIAYGNHAERIIETELEHIEIEIAVSYQPTERRRSSEALWDNEDCIQFGNRWRI
ncbi:hypothetical protein FGB62_241g00 [Gracilaria domingensis]|nr:hypothetical protein FGB62_241g00 [Gracilaria domingensis]